MLQTKITHKQTINQQASTKSIKNKPQKQNERHEGRKQVLAATGYNQQKRTSKIKPKELERFQADMKREEKKQARDSSKSNHKNKSMQQNNRETKKKGDIYET